MRVARTNAASATIPPAARSAKGAETKPNCGADAKAPTMSAAPSVNPVAPRRSSGSGRPGADRLVQTVGSRPSAERTRALRRSEELGEDRDHQRRDRRARCALDDAQHDEHGKIRREDRGEAREAEHPGSEIKDPAPASGSRPIRRAASRPRGQAVRRDIKDAEAIETRRSCAMSRNGTFTIVLFITEMNVPHNTPTAAGRRFLAGAAAVINAGHSPECTRSAPAAARTGPTGNRGVREQR